MGLFKFVKEAGEKLFGKHEAKAASTGSTASAAPVSTPALDFGRSLEVLVGDMGFSAKDFNVAFSDGRATVTGRVESQETREKIILVIGNVQGVAEVDDQLIVDKADPPAVFYTVQRGDTLSKIAREHYGNANKYPVIFEANRPMLKDPDKIYPGQVLRIPPVAS